jgi:hypothetical protein
MAGFGIAAVILLGWCGSLLAQQAGPASKGAAKSGATREEESFRKLGELQAVNKEIMELEKRLSRLRQFWQKTRTSLERDLGRAQRQVDARESHVKSLEAKIQKQKEELKTLEKKEADVTRNCKELARSALAYFGKVREMILAGIPWRKTRRIQNVATGEDLVRSDKPNPISVVSAVERIQKREEATGRITESGTVRITKDGKKREVQAFHLGRIALVFADKEGTVGGFVLPGGTIEKAASENTRHPGAMSTFIRAIDVLFKRRAPHIADLFFPGLPVSGKKKKE